MRRLLPWLGIAAIACATTVSSGALVVPEASWPSITLFVFGALCMLFVRVPFALDARACITLAALLVPACFLLHGYDRLGPALLIAGLLTSAGARAASDLRSLGQGLCAAGMTWSLCAFVVFLHGAITARVAQLPDTLVGILAQLGSIAGLDTAVDGKNIMMFSMREKHALAGTWTWFADPSLCAFVLAGILTLLLTKAPGRGRRVLKFCALSIAWLFVRATLSMALFMHTALRTDYDASLGHATQFWNPWYHAALLVPLALLASLIFAPSSPTGDVAEDGQPEEARPVPWLPLAASARACVTIVLGYFWTPSGARKRGRVLVSEHHSMLSDWSRWRWHHKEKDTTSTLRPYDTTWYGEAAAYNFASLYEYCSRFYEMDRLRERIDDKALAGCDVLVLKVPTAYYERAEIDAVHRFVEAGGGLLLIGEHTSVFGSGVTLNQIARKYGFEFRHDCLFNVSDEFSATFQQNYEPWLIPHAASQHMGPLRFAVSCSIDPGMSSGDAVLRGVALESLDADYHAANAYPQPDDVANMLPGSFVQAWSTESGDGRVLAFTDSTIMANFSFYEPGKSELFLGMLEWLNHEQGMSTAWLRIVGLLAALFALVAVALRPVLLVQVASVAIASTALAALGTRALNASANPFP